MSTQADEKIVSTYSKIEHLRLAARQALEADDNLQIAWRSLCSGDFDSLKEPSDFQMLKQLILHRIHPENAFGALAMIDRRGAVDVLLARYLGDGVDPDRKFGGYESELSTMLDDLHEIYGESVLRELVNHPRFNKVRLHDERVIEAFADSLDIDSSEFSDWLKKV